MGQRIYAFLNKLKLSFLPALLGCSVKSAQDLDFIDMTEKEIAETEADIVRPTNFIRQIIETDLEQGNNLPRYWCGHPAPYSEQLEKGSPTGRAFARAFRRNRTGICISVMPRVFA